MYKNNGILLSKEWRKYKKKNILQVSRAINSGIKMLSKCAVCGDKKSKFVRKQEAKWLFNNLVIGTLLCKIPISKDVLF